MNAGSDRAESRLVVAEAPPFQIRHKLPEDFPDDYAWRCDPELARYDGEPALDISYEEYLGRVGYDARYASPWHGSFSIDDAESRHIGNATYYNVSSGRDSAEIGMVIAEPGCRGNGNGSRLAIAFVRYLWEAYPFRRLELHTLEWNERAVRCFQRAGFEPTARVLRVDEWFIRMEARREWWLLWDAEGRFEIRPKGASRERARAPENTDAAEA